MTTYTEKDVSTNIALLNALPIVPLTTGEGAPGYVRMVEDTVAVGRTDFATAGYGVRLCRFPTNAKVKRVELFSDTSLVDGGTSSTALILGVGVIFSNSTIDGTPAAYQNLQPTTVGIGGGTTTAGTAVAVDGTSANFIFGSLTALTTSGAFPSYGLKAANGLGQLFGGEITHNGTLATYGEPGTWTQKGLIELFNFRDAQNNLIRQAGFFDLLVIVTTGYNTQPAAGYNLYGRVEYVL
jgi:hypothetical protein